MSTASVSFLFVDGTDAEAAEVNRNFTDLIDFLNNSVVHRDGATAMSGSFDAGSNRIVNVSSGTAGSDAVNKTQLDAVQTQLNAAGTVPVGAGMEWYSNTVPAKWLLQNGAAVSRSTYAALFAQIGVTFGAGDGVTTFNLPDRRDRFGIGVGVQGLNDALGETGGSRDSVVVTHTHPMPHTHGQDDDTVEDNNSGTLDYAVDGPGGFYNFSSGGGLTTDQPSTANTSAPTGAVAGTNANLPPFIAVNYIIYAGV
jgi:microcystin-dependent protein